MITVVVAFLMPVETQRTRQIIEKRIYLGLTVPEGWEFITIISRNRQAGMVLEHQLKAHIQIHLQEAERKEVIVRLGMIEGF